MKKTKKTEEELTNLKLVQDCTKKQLENCKSEAIRQKEGLSAKNRKPSGEHTSKPEEAKKELENLKAEIRRLEKEMIDKDKEITDVNKECFQTRAEVARLKKNLEEKDSEMAKLKDFQSKMMAMIASMSS